MLFEAEPFGPRPFLTGEERLQTADCARINVQADLPDVDLALGEIDRSHAARRRVIVERHTMKTGRGGDVVGADAAADTGKGRV